MAENRADRRPPAYLFGGRLRTSTLALILAFVVIWWAYESYGPGPDTSDQVPASNVVPPGFIPDPAYTWVPRTEVARPTDTETTTTPSSSATATPPGGDADATDTPTSGDQPTPTSGATTTAPASTATAVPSPSSTAPPTPSPSATAPARPSTAAPSPSPSPTSGA